MLAAIADTHAVVWYLFDDNRLSLPAREFLDNAAAAGQRVGLSSITLAEMVYLIEKGRLPGEALARLLAALDAADGVFAEIPFERSLVQTLFQVPRTAVPDLPDRIIAATALHLDVPVISRDHKIRMAGLRTIW